MPVPGLSFEQQIPSLDAGTAHGFTASSRVEESSNMWPAKAVHYHIGFLCRHLAIGCDEDLHLLVSPVAVGKDQQQEAMGNAIPTSARTEAQGTLPVTPLNPQRLDQTTAG